MLGGHLSFGLILPSLSPLEIWDIQVTWALEPLRKDILYDPSSLLVHCLHFLLQFRTFNLLSATVGIEMYFWEKKYFQKTPKVLICSFPGSGL